VNGGCIQWSALWVMSCEAESRNQRKLVTTSRIKFSLSPSKMCICTGVQNCEDCIWIVQGSLQLAKFNVSACWMIQWCPLHDIFGI
jgi:hypothetical protein